MLRTAPIYILIATYISPFIVYLSLLSQRKADSIGEYLSEILKIRYGFGDSLPTLSNNQKSACDISLIMIIMMHVITTILSISVLVWSYLLL